MNPNTNIKPNYEVTRYNQKIEEIINKKFGKFWKFLNTRYGKLSMLYATIVPVIFLTNYFTYDEFFRNPIYHASGFLSFFTFKVFDYLSTAKFIDETDHKFFEYGIPYVESSPLTVPHPTKRELVLGKKGKGILLEFFLAGLYTFLPPLGYACLSLTPWTYMNNYKITQKTKLWKKIGDAVKSKLENCSESEIESFLDKLEKNSKNLEEILEN